MGHQFLLVGAWKKGWAERGMKRDTWEEGSFSESRGNDPEDCWPMVLYYVLYVLYREL